MSTTESQSATITAGAALAQTLARAGVKIAFTVPGESLIGVLEELQAQRIKIVTTRHEGAASFMAEAAAQLTGRPTLVMAGRAPGAANLAIGLHAAQADSAPVIAIVGQVRREVRGREAFQELDLARTFEPMVKWAAEVREPSDVVSMTERAVATAVRGRPGPVLLSIPEDVLEESVPAPEGRAAHVDHQVEPDPVLVRKVLRLLLGAERPLILAGAGVLRARASDALVRFAETVQLPVVSSWRRGDLFPNDNPLYLGMTGLGSAAAVRNRIEEADALLVLGSRLGEMTTYGYSLPAATTRWVHVDIEPRAAVYGNRPEIVLASDAAAFLRIAQRLLSGAVLDAAGFEERKTRNVADREAYDAGSRVAEEPWDGPGIHPGRVVEALARLLPAEAILTTDAGDFGTWAARGYRFHRPGTFIATTDGAMGFGLPAAIAASVARPGRLGVALAGDGGFAMTMADLETAVRERAHVVAIVFDNGRYGTVWRHQAMRTGQAGLATNLGRVDFAAVAEACGALGIAVGSDEEFEPALTQALEAGRPAVLHLAMDSRWTTPDETGMVYEVRQRPETPPVEPADETAEEGSPEAGVEALEPAPEMEPGLEPAEEPGLEPAEEPALEPAPEMEPGLEPAEEPGEPGGHDGSSAAEPPLQETLGLLVEPPTDVETTEAAVEPD